MSSSTGTHPSELDEVVNGSPRRGEVEVEQPDGDPVTEHHVLEAHVVVRNDRASARVGHLVAPRTAVRIETPGRVVEPSHQRGHRGQRGVGLDPGWIGRQRDLTVDEPEPLTTVTVDADGQRGTLETDGAQTTTETHPGQAHCST